MKYILCVLLVWMSTLAFPAGLSLELCAAPAAQAMDHPSRFVAGKSFYSNILGGCQEYAVLLPKDYASSQSSYPVVYMLHGWGDKPESWNDRWLAIEKTIEELEAGGLQEMIYIFPSGYKSYYCNTSDGSYPYMDMFIQEFIPHIDATYRTIADKGHRAVTGYSMGGFGAAALAIRHPETFRISAPLSMSFRTDEMYLNEPQDGWDYQWGRIFGGQGMSGEARLTDWYKAHCPLYQFVPEQQEKLSQVRWFLHCGDDEDRLLIANDELHVLMRENGFEHEYRVADGAHTGTYWRYALKEVLPYMQFCMNGGKTWTPVQDFTFAGDRLDRQSSEECSGDSAIWFVHDGLDKKTVRRIEQLFQKEMPQGLVLSCDISRKPLGQWLERYRKKYGSDRYPLQLGIAVGEAGATLYEERASFDRLYFDNASLPEDLGKIDTGKFWYIGQTDDGAFYHEMGALYTACRLAEADFQYRVRNGQKDYMKDLFCGINYIIKLIFY